MRKKMVALLCVVFLFAQMGLTVFAQDVPAEEPPVASEADSSLPAEEVPPAEEPEAPVEVAGEPEVMEPAADNQPYLGIGDNTIDLAYDEEDGYGLRDLYYAVYWGTGEYASTSILSVTMQELPPGVAQPVKGTDWEMDGNDGLVFKQGYLAQFPARLKNYQFEVVFNNSANSKVEHSFRIIDSSGTLQIEIGEQEGTLTDRVGGTATIKISVENFFTGDRDLYLGWYGTPDEDYGMGRWQPDGLSVPEVVLIDDDGQCTIPITATRDVMGGVFPLNVRDSKDGSGVIDETVYIKVGWQDAAPHIRMGRARPAMLPAGRESDVSFVVTIATPSDLPVGTPIEIQWFDNSAMANVITQPAFVSVNGMPEVGEEEVQFLDLGLSDQAVDDTYYLRLKAGDVVSDLVQFEVGTVPVQAIRVSDDDKDFDEDHYLWIECAEPENATGSVYASVYPSNASNHTIYATPTDITALEVDWNGDFWSITPLKPGEHTVLFSSPEGPSYQLKVRASTGIEYEGDDGEIDPVQLGQLVNGQVKPLPSTVEVGDTFQLAPMYEQKNEWELLFDIDYDAGYYSGDVFSITPSGWVTILSSGSGEIFLNCQSLYSNHYTSWKFTAKGAPKLASASLNPSSLTLLMRGDGTPENANVGDSTLYTGLSLSPSDVAINSITWAPRKTGSTAVVSVEPYNDGRFARISAVKAGTDTIDITVKADTVTKKLTLAVTVLQGSKSVEVKPAVAKFVAVSVGKTAQMAATVLPTGTKDKTVTWKSDDSLVATVNSKGVVTGVSEGTATITATTRDTGVSGSYTVNVVVPISSITASPAKITLPKSTTPTDILTNSLNILPGGHSSYTGALVWSTDKAAVAAVDKDTGLLTAKSAGTAKVTAKNVYSGKSATFTVNVVDPDGLYLKAIDAAKLSLTGPEGAASIQLDAKQTAQLAAILDDTNLAALSSKALYRFESLNAHVASVSSGGLVTGLNAGTTTITLEVFDHTVNDWVASPETVEVRVNKALTSLAFKNPATGKKITSLTMANNGAVPSAVEPDSILLSNYLLLGPAGNSASLLAPCYKEGELDSSHYLVEVKVTPVPAKAAPAVTWNAETGRLEWAAAGTAKVKATLTALDAKGEKVVKEATLTVTTKRYAASTPDEFRIGAANKRYLDIGKSFKLTTQFGSGVTEKKVVEWRSSNPNAISVSANGTVKALNQNWDENSIPQPVSIIATAAGGMMHSISIEPRLVNSSVPHYPVSIRFSQTSFSAVADNSTVYPLSGIVGGPSSGTVWAISNPDVAQFVNADGSPYTGDPISNSLPSAYIKVVGVGKTTVTICELYSGKSAKITVTGVSADGKPLTKLAPKKHTRDQVLDYGTWKPLAVSYTPGNASNKNVKWVVPATVEGNPSNSHLTVQDNYVQLKEGAWSASPESDQTYYAYALPTWKEMPGTLAEAESDPLVAVYSFKPSTKTKSIKVSSGTDIVSQLTFEEDDIDTSFSLNAQLMRDVGVSISAAARNAFTAASSNQRVATVSAPDANGNISVTLKGKGAATLTLKANDNAKAKATIKVFVGSVANDNSLVVTNPSNGKLMVRTGKTGKISASLTGPDGYLKEFIYYISDAQGEPAVSYNYSVSSKGVVKGIYATYTPGYVTVKDLASGQYKTIQVTVAAPLNKVEAITSKVTLAENDSTVLTAKTSSKAQHGYDYNEADAVTWSTKNSGDSSYIAFSDEGYNAGGDTGQQSVTITALKSDAANRKVVVVAKNALSGKTAEFTVTILASDSAVKPATSVEVKKPAVELRPKKSITLSATALDASGQPATNKGVVWVKEYKYTDDSLTLGGKFTAGSIVNYITLYAIPAEAYDPQMIQDLYNTGDNINSISAEQLEAADIPYGLCNIRIRPALSSLKADASSLTVGKADKGFMKVTVNPTDYCGDDVTITSSNPAVATARRASFYDEAWEAAGGSRNDVDAQYKMLVQVDPGQVGTTTITVKIGSKSTKFTVIVQ